MELDFSPQVLHYIVNTEHGGETARRVLVELDKSELVEVVMGALGLLNDALGGGE